MPRRALAAALALAMTATATPAPAATAKPPLHAQKWLAITGKPLAATAGARIFLAGGNAVDAACAMLAATATMWDTLGWGGETQALIWHPGERRVIAINGLGVAPTGATPEYFRALGLDYPPEYGPLAAVTPGTPGGLLTMLADYGRLSLAEVLRPAIELAEGYPIEAQLADTIERQKGRIKEWTASSLVFLPHLGEPREAPRPGEIFRQPDLKATLEKLVEAEAQALAAGADRKTAIYAAHDRFYRGDIAEEVVRSVREMGGLFTAEDLASWKVEIEEPVSATYKGIEVFKLNVWTQGPAMLQALNILEPLDLRGMGYNSARYIHTVYQAMNLAYADRDFYYGDPYFPPEEPVDGLLSKSYAAERRRQIDWQRNDPAIGPGDPYPHEGRVNPFVRLEATELPDPLAPIPAEGPLAAPPAPVVPPVVPPAGPLPPTEGTGGMPPHDAPPPAAAALDPDSFEESFRRGTTSVVAADAEGWVVSMTPSGGWVPAVIAGRTGIGLSQRMQSFALDARENPFNVVAPGKRPRVTLTPTLALKDGAPWLAFAVQGGDTQDQNLLQFFLNVAEFGMTVQEATEAANIVSYQMRSSFGKHESQPGRLTVHADVPEWVRAELRRMGYRVDAQRLTSGPINAILFDRAHGTMWGGSSNHGEDHGIGW
ncbi:MAG: gamma-glutamyltransferase [Thermoanaerobaculia bacterium]|nr:gamma-glutamyltransferase [Thermoanaerobaculia bacterium]